MDTITISKLTGIFRDDSPYDLEPLMTKDEIKELEKNNIIYKDSNDFYLLDKKSLYYYSKKARDEKKYDLAIVILEYLASCNAKESQEWLRTNYYQLFKNYFLKGNTKLAYDYFKLGFDSDSKTYPIVLNLFRYLLKKPKLLMDLDDNIANKIKENRFNDLKGYINYHERVSSHIEIINSILESVNNKRKSISNNVAEYIQKGEIKEAIDYLEQVKKDNRSDSSLKYISSILYNYNLLKNDTISEVRARDLGIIIDLYRSNCLDKIMADNNIDEFYTDLLKLLFDNMNKYIKTTKYSSYVNNEAAMVVNSINTKCGVLIIDNLEQQDNKNYIRLAKKRKNVSINQIDNYYGKRIVLSNIGEKPESVSLSEIQKLYSKCEYHRCLKKCLYYIALNPVDNKEGYYYAALCYDKLNKNKQFEEFLDCFNFLGLNNFNSIGEKINKDANFYGIYNIREIINFANNNHISIDLACLHYGLSVEQIEIVELIIAKNYYGIGDTLKGDYYVNKVEDNNVVINMFKEEISNPDTYKYVDYEESKSFINLLERKK